MISFLLYKSAILQVKNQGGGWLCRPSKKEKSLEKNIPLTEDTESLDVCG